MILQDDTKTKYVENKPFTNIVIDGLHENHLRIEVDFSWVSFYITHYYRVGPSP